MRQLDFRLEALNLSAMRALQLRSPRAGELRFPELFESLSSDRVLVMEYLVGDTFSDLNEKPGFALGAGSVVLLVSAFVDSLVTRRQR